MKQLSDPQQRLVVIEAGNRFEALKVQEIFLSELQTKMEVLGFNIGEHVNVSFNHVPKRGSDSVDLLVKLTFTANATARRVDLMDLHDMLDQYDKDPGLSL